MHLIFQQSFIVERGPTSICVVLYAGFVLADSNPSSEFPQRLKPSAFLSRLRHD
jgi:hypothetical protein